MGTARNVELYIAIFCIFLLSIPRFVLMFWIQTFRSGLMFFCHQMAPFDCHGSLWKSWKIMWRQAHRSASLGGRGNVYILQFYTGNYFLICSGRACHSFLINQIENYCVTRDNKSTFNNYSVLVLANEALKMSCQKVVVIGVRNLAISAAWLLSSEADPGTRPQPSGVSGPGPTI